MIKYKLVLIFVFFASTFNAQLISYSVADYQKIGLRAVMNAALISENVLLSKQKDLIDQLADLEKQYEDKMSVNASIKAFPYFTSVLSAVELTKVKLNIMSTDINNLKVVPTSIKYGVFDIQRDIVKYNRELSRIRRDYLVYSGGMLASNGVADIQAAMIMLTIRALNLRNDVIESQLKLNNLLTLNRFKDVLSKNKF